MCCKFSNCMVIVVACDVGDFAQFSSSLSKDIWWVCKMDTLKVRIKDRLQVRVECRPCNGLSKS